MRNTQKISCPCGKVFAACVDGYQEEDWNLEVGKYMAKGCTSVINDLNFKFDNCECPNMDGSFKNQLKLDLK